MLCHNYVIESQNYEIKKKKKIMNFFFFYN